MTPPHVISVLIVEDERIVAKDLQQTLVEMGYDAYAIASSADEALARATARCPDLVLMDIRIKGQRDGVDTAALLRERFGVPVVFLTAHADEATIQRAKASEPYGYLMKPVRPAELRSVIEIASHRHAMEKRLRERERWFVTTLRSIGDAVITVDLTGHVSFLNAAAETLTGVKAEHALGRPVRDIVRLLDPSQPASPLDVVLEQQRPMVILEAPLAQATGATRIISDSVSPVVDEGQMLGAVMVFRDITEQKLLQQRLELADRLASLGTMAAGVAHEVNNPLAIVVGNVACVLEDLRAQQRLDPDPARLAGTIEALAETGFAAGRIARIVSELKAFSRPAPAGTGDADVGAAVDWAIRSTSHEYLHRATVVREVHTLRRARIDETRLGQILVNLLTNAAHAMVPGRLAHNVVTIGAREDGDAVVIEVRDTGSGMSPEVMRRLFEPFYTTRGTGSGTGLGLAICHGMVAAAGGRIEVESTPGAGSRFVMTLPAEGPLDARAPVAPVAAPVVTPDPAPAVSRRGRILAVDDEPMILKVLARMLRDHEVVGVETALGALGMLERGERFDVILSDITMPQLDGMGFYERLLVNHPEDARRVVFMTGGAVNSVVADFLAVVPNVRVQKPINQVALRALVQTLLVQLDSPPA